MKRNVYQRGVKGKKYGIWNASTKCWQFNIAEDTPMLAVARLHQKIGDDAKKWRFEPHILPDKLIENGVILPPCKTKSKLINLVGSTVYSYNGDFGVTLPYFVEKLNIEYYDKDKNCYTYEANCTNEEENELIDSIDFGLDDIGKTIFLTKEEAEEHLQKGTN